MNTDIIHIYTAKCTSSEKSGFGCSFFGYQDGSGIKGVPLFIIWLGVAAETGMKICVNQRVQPTPSWQCDAYLGFCCHGDFLST